MNRLIRAAARHPWLFLAALLIVTLLAASRIGDLRVSVSVESMMERGTAAWRLFQETEQTFGSDGMVIVAFSDPELFTPEKLRLVETAKEAIEALPFVSSTTSLFSVNNVRNDDGYISSLPYIGEIPETVEAAAEIRTEALKNPLLAGNLLAADGRTMAINVILRDKVRSPDFPQRATAAIEAVLTPLRGRLEQVFQIGAPAVQAALSERILRDQQGLLPLSLLVLLVTMGVALRRLSGALVPLLTAGMSVVWTLGFMVVLEIPLNVMTSIVPALIIVIGSTEDIHLLSEYFAGVRQGKGPMQAVDFMADNMGLTVLLTFVTTYIGFLSIAINDVELLRQFGLVASSGLLFNFIITVTLIPVLLRVFGDRMVRQRRGREGSRPGHIYVLKLAEWAGRQKRSVLLVVGGLCLVALWGATTLRVNNNTMDFLEASSPIRDRAEQLHDRLSGIHTFSTVVEGGIRNTFLQVHYLQELRRIQQHIAQMGVFDKSFSFADFVALVNQVMEDDEELQLPETDEILREYMLFIKHDDVRQYVSPTYDKAKILVRHNLSASSDLNAAVRQLQGFIDAEIDPALQVHITGESILSNKAVDAMSRGQLTSLALLGAAIVLVISVLFVNLKAGLLALLPNLFPVVVLFGVMGFGGIPLDTGTGMVAAIALGICIDDTMHAMSRYHMELKATRDQDAALRAMLQSEAVPIITTSLALAAGFAVLALSSFTPVVHFGLLSAMVILLALVATFLITPLLLGSAQLLTVWELLSFELRNERLKQAPLFRGMNLWQIKKVLLASEIRSFAAGDFIVREGERGSEMFVVLDGKVSVQKRQPDGSVKEFRIMGAGELFGEVAPLTHGIRTADVVALEKNQVLVLSWEHIDRLSRLFPIISFKLFRNFTGILSRRLAQTDEYKVNSG